MFFKFIENYDKKGGVTTYNHGLLKLMKASDFEYTFIINGKLKRKLTVRSFEFLFFIVYLLRNRVGIKKIPYILKRFFIFEKYLKDKKPKKLICLNDHLNERLYIYSYFRDVKKLVDCNVRIYSYIHGREVIENYKTDNEVVLKLSKLNDGLITNSYSTRSLILSNFSMDAEVFYPFLTSDFIKRAQDRQTKKENIVLFVGAISNVKGISDIVSCWKFARNNNFKLIIIGDGNVNLDINDSDNIQRVENTRENIERYFSMSKYFVNFSKREPFGIVLIEALAHGCRPIIPNVGGMTEIIDDSNGIVINRDKDSLRCTFRELAVNVEPIYEFEFNMERAKRDYFELQKDID